MPLTRLLRLLPLIAVAVALAILASPLTSHAAPAGQLLLVTSDVTYDIRPDAGPVHVSWDVRVDHQDPVTVERVFGAVFFSASLPVPVPLPEIISTRQHTSRSTPTSVIGSMRDALPSGTGTGTGTGTKPRPPCDVEKHGPGQTMVRPRMRIRAPRSVSCSMSSGCSRRRSSSASRP